MMQCEHAEPRPVLGNLRYLWCCRPCSFAFDVAEKRVLVALPRGRAKTHVAEGGRRVIRLRVYEA